MVTGLSRPVTIFVTWLASSYTPTLGDIITLSGTKSTVTASEGYIRFYDSNNVLRAHQDLTIDNTANTFTTSFNTTRLGSGTYTMRWMIHNLRADDNFGAVHYKTGSNASSSQTIVIASSTTYDDPLVYMKEYLKNNWNSANTDGFVPGIYTVGEKDRLDLRRDKGGIIVYSVNHQNIVNSIGELSKQTEDQLAIDMRSTHSRAHAIKIRKEVERLIDINLTPEDDYSSMDHEDWQDLSDASTNFWRFVMHAKLTVSNKARGT